MAKAHNSAAAQQQPQQNPQQNQDKENAVAAQPKGGSADTLLVYDSSCIQQFPTREHVLIVDGIERSFTFQFPKPLELPRAVAMKFLKSEGFRVTEMNGKEVARIPDQPDPLSAQRPFILKEDQVVAALNELTSDALATRANMEIGGEKFDSVSRRVDMIRFLTAKRQERDAALKPKRRNPDADSDNLMEGFVPEEFDASERGE
jgi:hypothetical protein